MHTVAETLRIIHLLLRGKRYAELGKLLAGMDLKALGLVWEGLSPIDKLVVFKLLDASRAMDFYGMVPFKEKYYLLCGFPLNVIAPVLEGLEVSQRRLFLQLPQKFYDRMFRQIVSERVEITVSLRNN
jgi:hypothetical protein